MLTGRFESYRYAVVPAAALSLSRQVQRHSGRAERSNGGLKPKTLNLMHGAFRCKASAFLLPRLKVNLHTYKVCQALLMHVPDLLRTVSPKPQVTLMTWLLSFFVPSPAGASPCTFFLIILLSLRQQHSFRGPDRKTGFEYFILPRETRERNDDPVDRMKSAFEYIPHVGKIRTSPQPSWTAGHLKPSHRNDLHLHLLFCIAVGKYVALQRRTCIKEGVRSDLFIKSSRWQKATLPLDAWTSKRKFSTFGESPSVWSEKALWRPRMRRASMTHLGVWWTTVIGQRSHGSPTTGWSCDWLAKTKNQTSSEELLALSRKTSRSRSVRRISQWRELQTKEVPRSPLLVAKLGNTFLE